MDGSDKSFGLTFAAVFALAALWAVLWHSAGVAGLVLICMSGLLMLAAFAFPRLLAPANRVWTRIGQIAHQVMNPVLLGLFYFAVITPVGLAMRLAGRDLLGLARGDDRTSYWHEAGGDERGAQAMKDQF